MTNVWETSVYVVAAVEDGRFVSPIKIGIARNPLARCGTLRTACPFEIDLFSCIRGPTRELARIIESILHERFADNRIRGEWFDVDPAEATKALWFLVALSLETCLGFSEQEAGRIVQESGMADQMRKLAS